METSSTRMKTTKKRMTKTTSSAFLESLRHPDPPLHHLITRRQSGFTAVVCARAYAAQIPSTWRAAPAKESGITRCVNREELTIQMEPSTGGNL